MLHVVAGIIELDDYILICQRHRDSKRFPLKWEFPGGKIETGETPAFAIQRELREELGIICKEIDKFDEYSFSYPGEAEFRLHFFRIISFEHTVKNLQFERMAWIRKEDIIKYDMLEGDLPFIKRW